MLQPLLVFAIHPPLHRVLNFKLTCVQDASFFHATARFFFFVPSVTFFLEVCGTQEFAVLSFVYIL